MEFTVHEIGNHQFIETKGYIVAMTKGIAKEVQIENLKANFEKIKERTTDEDEAFKIFTRRCGMRNSEDWLNYQYDGHFTHLLEDHGFTATLPIKHALGGSIQLTIQYWKEQEGQTLYCVFDSWGKWQGTIRNHGENPKDFFERFIGEICFHNGILEEEFHNRLFPFSSKTIRKDFDFSPAFVGINPVRDYLGI